MSLLKKFFSTSADLFKSVKNWLYRKINERLFSYKKLAYFIHESLETHLNLETELTPGTVVKYDIIADFSAEDTALVESQEKDSNVGGLLAITSTYDVDDYYICFALEAMKNSAFKLLTWQVKKEIQDTAKHEAFHVRQYHYVCRHGGLEPGAYLYQWFDEVQNFEEYFQYFIIPPVCREADQVAA